MKRTLADQLSHHEERVDLPIESLDRRFGGRLEWIMKQEDGMSDLAKNIAAAERAVVEAAIAWYAVWRVDPAPGLTNAVMMLLRLRAAQASQGSGE